jgi:hypothetical protein
LTFLDEDDNAIVVILDNGLDLGIVTAKAWVEASEPMILQNPNASNCTGYSYAAMKRHLLVTSDNYPNGMSFGGGDSIDIVLMIKDDELQDLITAASANDQPGNSCTLNDNLSGLTDLYVTKYSGDNEDGDYTNNDSSDLYLVFGPTTSYPTQPDGPLVVTANGFGPNRHTLRINNLKQLSEFWLHGSGGMGTPLPVEMLYLEAQAMDNSYIQVRWGTAVEIDNNGFQVERSIDGQSWSAIGWVDGNGNTTVTHHYHYNDYNVTAGIRYYYRLKQIDNDGDYEYTGIVSAIINTGITFSVKDFIPNPATHTTTLFITSTGEQSIEVDIYNAIGQKMLSQRHTLNKGSNQLPFNLDQFAAGSYTAIVSSGNEVYSKKLVVVK